MIPENILRKAIDTAYMRYDRDHSNTLNKYQLQNCLSDVIHLTGSTLPVNSFIVGQLMKRIDSNHDGQISKPQFLNLFRWFESNAGSLGGFGGNNNNYGNNGYNNQGYNNNYNGYGYNDGYNQNQGGFNNYNQQPQQKQHWWNKFT